MSEIKKRETAYKMRIGNILNGTPIVEEIAQEIADPTQKQSGATKERFRFLEVGSKKIIRVNLIANIIELYNSEGEKNFSSITIDDASGQIRAKLFGEDANKTKELSQGDTILIIGPLRSYNQEVYLSPEIIKKIDPKYLLIRKLELEKSEKTNAPHTIEPKKSLELKDQIIELIKTGENTGGIGTEELILKITTAPPEAINSEVIKLLEDGLIYEPRPGRVRWLG